MTLRKLMNLALVGVGAILASPVLFAQAPLQTVPQVDLSRYTGRWYEIARYPNRFERNCDRNAMAVYTLRPDGKVGVVNSCTTNEGKYSKANGWAKVADSKTGAKLKVTFFWPFFGDYWVIDLGPKYEYAVVGEPSRKYLWILSRTPKMDQKLYAEIVGRLSAKGYNSAKLERVKQTE